MRFALLVPKWRLAPRLTFAVVAFFALGATAQTNSAAIIWPQASEAIRPNPAIEMAAAFRDLLRIAEVPAERIRTLGSSAAYGANIEQFVTSLTEAASALDLSRPADLYVVVLGHANMLMARGEDMDSAYSWVAGPNRSLGPAYSSGELLGALKRAFPTGSQAWRNLHIHFVLNTCFSGNCLQEFQLNFVEFDFPRFTFLASSGVGRMSTNTSGHEVLDWAFRLERELRARHIDVCLGCSRFETVAKIFGVMATAYDYTRRTGQGYAYGRERNLRAWSADEAVALLYVLPTLVTSDFGVWQSAFGLLSHVPREVLAERPELQIAPIQALARVRDGQMVAAIEGYLRSPISLSAETELGFAIYLARLADESPEFVRPSLRNALESRRDQLVAVTGAGRGVRSCRAFFARR